MLDRIGRYFLIINISLFTASVLFVVYASLNGLWMFSFVIPIQVIHLIFSLRNSYQELTRLYQECSPSFAMNALNISITLFVDALFLIGVLSGFENFLNTFGSLFIAIIAMMSITSSSLVGEGLAQIIYERRNEIP